MEELRQIRTLRLGASRREQVTRTAIALEDALRAASLPRLPHGAILLVRRFDLGRLPADASPQWLSRRIEERLQSLQLTPAGAPHHALESASAVCFADRSEALAALLAATLQGAPRAWYWRGVLPGWRRGMSMRHLLPRALRHAGSGPDAAVGATALLDRLLKLDRLGAVLEHLELDHVAAVAPTAALAPPMASAAHLADDSLRVSASGEGSGVVGIESRPAATDTPASSIVIASAAWRDVLIRWARRWGVADQRSSWLAGHALVAVHGPAAAAEAARLVADLTALMPRSRADPDVRPTDRAIRESPVRLQNLSRGTSQPAGSGSEVSDKGPAPASELMHGAGPSKAPPSAEVDWQPTCAGGLLLLLPAIARLEIAEADPDGDLCLHLLHRIAERFQIGRGEAIRRALPKPLPRLEPWSFGSPDAWRGLLRLRGRLDLCREAHVLAACQLALARFLRRHARISPRRLVRRPALVHATPTHIDLCFDARWVELEVRLAGLDLDPGWVPWLGRVVTFHYDYGGQP